MFSDSPLGFDDGSYRISRPRERNEKGIPFCVYLPTIPVFETRPKNLVMVGEQSHVFLAQLSQ
jgi:hypothetical protein